MRNRYSPVGELFLHSEVSNRVPMQSLFNWPPAGEGDDFSSIVAWSLLAPKVASTLNFYRFSGFGFTSSPLCLRRHAHDRASGKVHEYKWPRFPMWSQLRDALECKSQTFYHWKSIEGSLIVLVVTTWQRAKQYKTRLAIDFYGIMRSDVWPPTDTIHHHISQAGIVSLLNLTIESVAAVIWKRISSSFASAPKRHFNWSNFSPQTWYSHQLKTVHRRAWMSAGYRFVYGAVHVLTHLYSNFTSNEMTARNWKVNLFSVTFHLEKGFFV